MPRMDLELVQDIPGYKTILKSVLKTQIQLLVEQLCEQAGEESIILTASLSDGSLSHLGSKMGKGFFEEREEIKSQFLGHCLKNVYNTSKLFEKNNSSDTQIEGLSSQKKQRLDPELGLAVNQDNERHIPLGMAEPATRIMPVAGIGTRKLKRKMHTPSHSPAPSPSLTVTSPVAEASILSDESTDTRKTQKKKPVPSESAAPNSNLSVISPVLEVSDLPDESTRKTQKKKPLSSQSLFRSTNLSETSPVSDHSTDSQVVKDENDEDDDGWEPDDYTHLIDSECSLNMAKSILSSVRLHQTETKDLDDGNRHSNKGVSNASGQLENASLKQSGGPKLEHLDGNNPDSRIKIESVTDEGEALGINGIDRTLRAMEEEPGHHTDFTGQEIAEIDDYHVLKEDTKELKKDMDSQTRQMFQCERCGLEFRTNSSLVRHVKHIHDQNDKYKCKICGKIEAEKHRLKTHIEVKHEGRCWICEVCACPFKSSGGLRQHMKIKHSDMVVKKARYRCRKCSKPFKDKDVYLGHMSKHDGAKLYTCCLCSRQYQYKNNLKAHILSQHSGKSVKCDHCEMSFGSNKQLQDHVNGKHTQVEKYGCECGKRFRWRSSLSFHRKKCLVMWLK